MSKSEEHMSKGGHTPADQTLLANKANNEVQKAATSSREPSREVIIDCTRRLGANGTVGQFRIMHALLGQRRRPPLREASSHMGETPREDQSFAVRETSAWIFAIRVE